MRRFFNPRERLYEANPYQENLRLQQIANDYCLAVGFPPLQPTPYEHVNQVAAREIAAIYEEAVSTPDDPDTRMTYDALANEIDAQFALLPFHVTPVDGADYPYKSSEELMDDLLQNQHMYVFNGGEDHPLLTREQNFKFRAIHDAFGHAAHGFAFGPRGENASWIEHSKMFSPSARRAMTTETRGQNSWVNWGPYSKLPPVERPYAVQKVFILPEKFQTVPVLLEAYAEYPGFYSALRLVAANRRGASVKLADVEPGWIPEPHVRGTPVSAHQGVLFDVKPPKQQRKLKKVVWCFREENTKRLQHYFGIGQDGLHWYDTTYPSILEFFGRNEERAVLFVYLLAATSPLTNIRENIQRALYAYQIGEQFGATAAVFEKYIKFEAHRLNIMRAFRGEPLSGPKVTNFAKNLFGPEFRDARGQVVYPDAADAVTVDRWVMRAVQGVCNEEGASLKDDAPTEPQYRCIENAIKKLAYEVGVQPRQYQAAIWVGIKLECGDMNDTANPFDVELRTVSSRIASQGRFDFDFDPEYASFERGLEAVAFYEERHGKARNPGQQDLAALEAAILDPGDGEYVLENARGA